MHIDTSLYFANARFLEAQVNEMLALELGGFGLGAETNSAWQIQAYAGYRFSELFQIQGGYRVIGLDFETGSGADRFL